MQVPTAVKSRITLLAMAGLLFFTYATIKISPQPQSQLQPHPQPHPQPSLIDIVPKTKPLITGFSFTEYDAGNKTFTINAEKMFLCKKKVRPFGFRVALGKSVEMDGVEASFYKDGKPVSHLNSKKAVMDIRKKDIIFEGRPVLITEDKRVLGADKIVWNNPQQRLFAQGRCFIGANGKTKEADAVHADVALNNFTMEGLR